MIPCYAQLLSVEDARSALIGNPIAWHDREVPDEVERVKDIFGREAALRRLLICTGPCCNSSGDAQLLLQGLRNELLDARLNADLVAEASCVRRSCLGKCTGEPLAYADPDGIWYHKLTVENLLRILREHVLGKHSVPELVLDEDV